MTLTYIKKIRKNSETIFYHKYALVIFIIFFFAFTVLRFPETAGQGISEGIDICLGTLIPSLYPFMVISSLIINLNITDLLEKHLSRISNFIFRLPGKCLGIILLSFVGGFPVGGKMIKEMYEKEEITASQGQQLLLFCVSPGPAFAISSVGFYMLGSKKAGLIIYISLISASIIIGVLSRFFITEEIPNKHCGKASDIGTLSQSLIKSVSAASSSMLGVCSWVVIFSCINKLLEITAYSDSFKMFLYCILEVTNGCLISAGNLPVPIIAGIIGFGGICTHLQIMSAVNKVGLKYKHFITARILCGALSVVICNFILKFCPVSYSVFSCGTLPKEIVSGISAPVSVGMLIMCILAVFGDRLYIKIKSVKK